MFSLKAVVIFQILFFISTNVICYSSNISLPQEQYLFDFTKSDNVENWQEQSDTVRDVGMSKAVFVLHQNTAYRRAIFFALLNPQLNGAGFAGVRAIKTYNLTGHTKLQIQCRGQGQYNGFKMVLRHKGLNDEPNYSFEQFFQSMYRILTFLMPTETTIISVIIPTTVQFPGDTFISRISSYYIFMKIKTRIEYFQGPKDEFSVRNLPFSEFKAYYRGKRVNNNETLDISQITSIGIQMYGGVYQPIKQKGPATLEIDWIRAV